MKPVLLALLAASVALAGCFHGGDDSVVVDGGPRLSASNETLEKIEGLVAAKPLRFSFPGQLELPRAVLWINGTIGPDAATSYEFPQNRGGTSYNTIVLAQDIGAYLPPGQPAVIDLRLWWSNAPGRGVKLDPFIDVPGTLSSAHRGYQDEWTWTLPVKNASVATVGVAGVPARLGVEVANAKVLPGQEVSYTLRAEFTYAKDVLTPFHPWAVEVPANASGLILSSVKPAGDRHVAAQVLVVGPDDELVSYVEYDDLAIPSESIFIPVRSPGEHVIYAVKMESGFLSVRADRGLDAPLARPLDRVESEQILVGDPVAPGVPGHVVGGTPVGSPQGGAEARFVTGPQFPLLVEPFLESAGTVVVDADLYVHAGSNLVARYHRFLRYDDERGRLGVSDEHDFGNRVFNPSALLRGEMLFKAILDGSTAKAGVRVLTYAR